MRIIYEKPDYVKTTVDPALNVVIATWYNLCDGDVIKESCLAQLEEVKKGAVSVIVDTYNARGVPPQESQEWFGATLFPGFGKAGLKAIITVLPKSPTAKLGARRWKETGSQFSFTMYETESLKSAKDLAKEIAK